MPNVSNTLGEAQEVGWGGRCCVLELVITCLIMMIYIDYSSFMGLWVWQSGMLPTCKGRGVAKACAVRRAGGFLLPLFKAWCSGVPPSSACRNHRGSLCCADLCVGFRDIRACGLPQRLLFTCLYTWKPCYFELIAN